MGACAAACIDSVVQLMNGEAPCSWNGLIASAGVNDRGKRKWC